MADKESKEGRTRGRELYNRGKDAKQTKLKLEETGGGKRVTFKGAEIRDLNVHDMLEKLKLEVRMDMDKVMTEWREKFKIIEEKVNSIEGYIEEKREEERLKKEEEDRWRIEEGRESSEEGDGRSVGNISRSRSSISKGSMGGFSLRSRG